MADLTHRQRKALLDPVHPDRVAKNPQGMSHLESYDVIAHLTYLFGFEGWDSEVVGGPQMIFEEEHARPKGKSGWDCAYWASVRLTIRNPRGEVVTIKEDSATGDASNQSTRAAAHDLALKSAVSTAEKRAARKLGDQFGLSLYDKGSLEAVVKTSLAYYKDVHDSAQVAPAQLVQQEGEGLPEHTPAAPATTDQPSGQPQPPSDRPMITQQQIAKIHAMCGKTGENAHDAASRHAGRLITSLKELQREEATTVIQRLVDAELMAIESA